MALGHAYDSVLAAAQAGAPWALERLWRDLAPLVGGYLRLQGATEPDDLTSEVFLSALRTLDRFSGSEHQLRSWLLTIAHRRLLDERRRRARRPQPDHLDENYPGQPGGDVEDEALARLGSDRVQATLARLAPDQRAVLVLRILGDLTVEQVATVLDKRPGAVKALQRRGLASLRRLVEAEGVPL